MAESNKSILEILPWRDVLFRSVFQLLSVRDLFRLRLVSQAFHEMMEDYFAQCEHICVTEADGHADKKAFEIMSKNNTSLRTVIIHNAADWMDDDTLVPIVSDCPSLQTIDLSGCTTLTNRSLCMMGMYCGNLTHVWLKECSWIDQDNFMVFISGNPLLKLLDISQCTSLDDACIKFMAKSCKNLESLNISDIPLLSDCSLEIIAKTYRGLRQLNIVFCWRMTNAGVVTLMEYCRKLKTLNCRNCPSISEQSLARLRSRGVEIDVEPPLQSTLSRLEHLVNYLEPAVRPIHHNM